MIFETEGETSLTLFPCRKDIRHVRLLVVEDTDALENLLNSTDDVFHQARIDLILFRLQAKSVAAWVAFGIFRARIPGFSPSESAVTPVTSCSSRERTSYLAIRREIAHEYIYPIRGLFLP